MDKIDPATLGHQGSSIGMLLLFATNACVLVSLELGIRANPMTVRFLKESDASEARRNAAGGKTLSKPLSGTVQSVRGLCREVARLGAAMGLTWLCEYHPVFAHSTKYWERDLYYFLCLLLLVYSLQHRKQLKIQGDVLNREQTEEWKGWMQFMFLLYHYYKADEVYNGIRVMITCYVWMTGFGNFSFFYIKRDFGLVRVLQMLWRLNFLVAMLCLVMGNTYLLYYICPLHTFFFFLVYFTMRAYPSLNHSKWGIRCKLLAVAGIIFLVWDLPRHCLFRAVFTPLLGTTPVIGATGGSLWEWYFRTGLDHWATFLGMVFALNYPLMQAWFTQVDASVVGWNRTFWTVKGPSAVAIGLVGLWWTVKVFPLAKPEYNLTNPYMAFVPLLVYVFFRNFTPALRSVYLVPLHNIGKTTLETYLMQHHVWLTSNAKTLVTVVPGGYPLINALVVTVGFVALSQELYRITMSLRGILLPDDRRACTRNLVVVVGLVAAFVATGSMLCRADLGGSPYALTAVTLVATLVALTVIQKNIDGVAPPVLDKLPEASSRSASPPTSSPSLPSSTVASATAGSESGFDDKSGGSGGRSSSPLSSSHSSGDLKGIPSQAGYAVAAARPSLPRLAFIGALLVATFFGLAAYTASHTAASRILQPVLLSRPYTDLEPKRAAAKVEDGPASVDEAPAYIEEEPQILVDLKALPIPSARECMALSNRGSWTPPVSIESNNPGKSISGEEPLVSNPAVSVTHEWVWDSASKGVKACDVGHIEPVAARKLLAGGARVLVAGDSVARNFYYALARSLGDDVNNAHNASAPRHADISLVLPSELGGGNLRFLWAPYAANLTHRLDKMATASKKMPDVLVMGAGLWDALWVRDVNSFKHLSLQLQSRTTKQRFVEAMARRQGQQSELADRITKGDGSLIRKRVGDDMGRPVLPLVLWIDATAVVDERLASATKRVHMRDAIVQRHYSYHGVNEDPSSRPLVYPGKYDTGVDGLIEGRAITAGRESDSVDGVHYDDVVYDVMAQILLNQIRSAGGMMREDLGGRHARKKSAEPPAPTPKPTEVAGSAVKPSVEPPKPVQVVHEVCEMARPSTALLLIGIVLVMLFTMDNFFGITTIVLYLCGNRDLKAQVTWEAAYGPLHRKIGIHQH